MPNESRLSNNNNNSPSPLTWLAIILVIGGGYLFSRTHSNASSDPSNKSAKTEQVSKNKISEKKKTSESKAITAKRKQNEKTNYQRYLIALQKLPQTSKGAITHAYYDKNYGTTYITLNNEILNVSDSQLKSAVHNAWNIGENYYDKYSPMPDSITALQVTVQDESGNRLGHTSIMGNFKYDASGK